MNVFMRINSLLLIALFLVVSGCKVGGAADPVGIVQDDNSSDNNANTDTDSNDDTSGDDTSGDDTSGDDTSGDDPVVENNFAQLSWTGPTTNDDDENSPLTDLAGYYVYMSRMSGMYTEDDRIADIAADANGGEAETYRVEDLDPGTYYFVVVAYDNNIPPNVSDMTEEVSKYIEN